MVVTDKPTKIYCCSDHPALEARILAIFSLITSCFCSFLLFLVYAHVQSQYLVLPGNETDVVTNQTVSPLCSRLLELMDADEEYLTDKELKANVTNPMNANSIDNRNKSAAVAVAVEKQAFTSQANNSYNGSKLGSQQDSGSNDGEDAYDSDSEYSDIDNDFNRILMEECGVNKTNSKKPKGMTTLDNLASFMAWNKRTQQEWILIPFLWNGFDVLRAVLLLRAVEKTSMVLAKTWYALTVATCLCGTGITFAVLMSSATGTDASFKIAFTHIFALILLYNMYGLWIVYLFIKEMRTGNAKTVDATASQAQDPSTSSSAVDADSTSPTGATVQNAVEPPKQQT